MALGLNSWLCQGSSYNCHMWTLVGTQTQSSLWILKGGTCFSYWTKWKCRFLFGHRL